MTLTHRKSPPQPTQSIPTAEHSELQRQGAKAAARGEPVDCNPMGRPLNEPGGTGESETTWQARSDAWRQGHDAQRQQKRSEGAGKQDGDDDDRE